MDARFQFSLSPRSPESLLATPVSQTEGAIELFFRIQDAGPGFTFYFTERFQTFPVSAEVVSVEEERESRQ